MKRIFVALLLLASPAIGAELIVKDASTTAGQPASVALRLEGATTSSLHVAVQHPEGVSISGCKAGPLALQSWGTCYSDGNCRTFIYTSHEFPSPLSGDFVYCTVSTPGAGVYSITPVLYDGATWQWKCCGATIKESGVTKKIGGQAGAVYVDAPIPTPTAVPPTPEATPTGARRDCELVSELAAELGCP